MNLLDFLILLPIAYFCFRGFMNGLIKEVLSIVGIILAVFLTFQYMEQVGTIIRPFFADKASFIPFVSGLIIFVGTLAIVNLAAFISKKFLETVKLNFINRLGGLAFGFLKSGIIVSALLLILAGFNIPSSQSREESVSYSYIIYLAPWAYDTVAAIYPGAEDFTTTVRKTLKQYNPIENFPFLDKEKNRNS
ncbi:MAG: CvpA family protein [Balneolaceae bacterium]|jgi:membrane protein required for colicin V production